jgi:S-adenosylmethionine synthetase
MTPPPSEKGRRFAEAVCAGHPDRLADSIADGIVALATSLDPDALVGVEVALHRKVVFVDGRIAAGFGRECAVTEEEVAGVVREAYARAGYGDSFDGPKKARRYRFEPASAQVDVRFDLCLGPLEADERAFRRVADDQVIGVGYACMGERAGLVPLEQALARDFVKAIEGLRTGERKRWIGPDGKVLVAVRGSRLEAVSLSLHHAADADWLKLCALARKACLGVAAEYVAARELEAPGRQVEWLFNGAGVFEVGGPLGDNGLSGKKLVAEAYGTAVPVGGGTVHGKDPLKPDVRAQRIARERAVSRIREGSVEATVWVVFRPGDEEPRWVEEQIVPIRRPVL